MLTPRGKAWLVGGGVALVLGGSVAAAVIGWPRYRAWSSARALQAAQEAQLSGELRRQQLFLEQAVQMDSTNMEARRGLAEFASTNGLPTALGLWDALVQAEAGNIQNHRGLILAQVKAGRADQAAAVFGRIPAELRGTLEYHRMGALVAVQTGNGAELAVHVDALSKLSPDVESMRFSRSAIALGSRDEAERSGAFSELVEFARKDAFRIRGTILLLSTLPTPADAQALDALAVRILGERPRALFARTRYGLADLMHHMMSQPAPSEEEVVALMDWMQQRGLSRDALMWCGTQDAKVRNAPVVLLRRAACAQQLGHWRELREAVQLGAWGQADEDIVTLVFASRIQRDAGSLVNSRSTWSDAFAKATKRPLSMRVMQRVAEGWGWRAESLRCLRELVQLYPADESLWVSLVRAAQAEGDTEGTLQALAEWSRVRGEPPRVVAEQLVLLAILDRLSPEQAARLARDAASEQAAPPLRLAAALEASRKTAPSVLPEFELARLSPRARLAYALLAQRAGRAAEAVKAVEGLSAVAWLPEEKALLSKIQSLSASLEKK